MATSDRERCSEYLDLTGMDLPTLIQKSYQWAREGDLPEDALACAIIAFAEGEVPSYVLGFMEHFYAPV